MIAGPAFLSFSGLPTWLGTQQDWTDFFLTDRQKGMRDKHQDGCKSWRTEE